MSPVLAINGGERAITISSPHFVWPIITDSIKNSVIKQLETAISIYDKSGIFKDFENLFCKYVGRKYAVVCNSGTNSLFGIYEGINLKPTDEVIVPAYTFFATASPITYTGATVVFADCLSNGNINPDDIEHKITENTKAIVVTHMWGIPCDIDKILTLSKKYGLYLIEDCSHAHGAKYKGQVVGSFGDAAAWSLQGQKIITAGEGGIILTDNEDIYYRSLLQGHYNKRCKQEIPTDYSLSKFSLTGFGLKNRAHPLGIAMAIEQLNNLDIFLKIKREYAQYLIKSLSNIAFLEMPRFENSEPSWYAFIMKYNAKKALGISRETFVKALHAEGLIEIDIPNSTCPIFDLPLFSEPHQAMPRLYKQKIEQSHKYPIAKNFYQSVIKLPVWAQEGDKETVEQYIKGIIKVSNNLNELL